MTDLEYATIQPIDDIPSEEIEACPPLKAPFTYFGGKSKAAPLVWDALGPVPIYIEPFFGSGAVLLARPNLSPSYTETVNDLDGFISNFYRALQADPEAVAYWADFPVSEVDLHARHSWLVNRSARLRWSLEDPDFYDVKIAGWWVWGISASIGAGWCSGRGSWYGNGVHLSKNLPGDEGIKLTRPQLTGNGQGINRKRPHLLTSHVGINRQLPHLSCAGQGINRQLPHLSCAGQGINRSIPQIAGGSKGINRSLTELGDTPLYQYFGQLARRLRRVRVCNGDWSRVCTPSVTSKQGLTGVFLDPPYSDAAGRDDNIYAQEDLQVAHRVREWAIANGDNPLMRIVLAGYEGEHQMPSSWQMVPWLAGKGYAGVENENRRRERLWLSPHCLTIQQARLF